MQNASQPDGQRREDGVLDTSKRSPETSEKGGKRTSWSVEIKYLASRFTAEFLCAMPTYPQRLRNH
ncbi:hypothetical protein, partial [Caulobacter radicis]|uniref:hypothetical protein n=1 Tax=Caulobacter radicis TaxID=2172650 RepID=UPI001A9C55C0